MQLQQLFKQNAQFNRFFRDHMKDIEYIYSVPRNRSRLNDFLLDVVTMINKSGIIPGMRIIDQPFSEYTVRVYTGTDMSLLGGAHLYTDSL